jgi:hypothetical protein
MNYYWIIAGIVVVLLFFAGLALYLYEASKKAIIALYYDVSSIANGALMIVSAAPVTLAQGDSITVYVENSNAVGAQATAINSTFGSGYSATVQSIDSTNTNIVLKGNPSSLSSVGPINISVEGYFRGSLF